STGNSAPASRSRRPPATSSWPWPAAHGPASTCPRTNIPPHRVTARARSSSTAQTRSPRTVLVLRPGMAAHLLIPHAVELFPGPIDDESRLADTRAGAVVPSQVPVPTDAPKTVKNRVHLDVNPPSAAGRRSRPASVRTKLS